ncbi:uncharacterized protein LOC126840759 [Adelges cooleyi]|uniref:uncharacterized protein LOC126840759 n=1 Tax=Adelges cooleyi TaxID=133065 RepID=UPI00217F230B|nr:uncharacterized protein LOC126840759 [Adelges cooleyi]
MKSNMNIVLAAMFFYSLIISGTSEDDLPSCISNLRYRLHLSWFGLFLTDHQLKNHQFQDTLHTNFVKAAKEAKSLIIANKIDEGRAFLIKSIIDESINNRDMNVAQTIQVAFNGKSEVAIKLIENFVELFISEIINDNTSLVHQYYKQIVDL